MSKIQELREKYPQISKPTFNKFVEADYTPTKKYLEYFLKLWSSKAESQLTFTSNLLIDSVRSFDTLLPYISNKDIYSKEYTDLTTLCAIIRKAENVKEEKTFDREKNIQVLSENDNFLLLIPTTHLGSVRYGSKTKWCTASRTDKQTFNNYRKEGLLVYLIDKTNGKAKNYEKIALYLRFEENEFNCPVEIFNAPDKRVHENQLVLGGWSADELFEIFTIFRYTFYKTKHHRMVKADVDNFVSTIQNLNFDKLNENLKKLEQSVDDSYISNVKSKVDEFINNINKMKCNLIDQK